MIVVYGEFTSTEFEAMVGGREAEQWYRRGAESGHIPAMVNLGALLANSGMVDEGERWMRRGAEAGDAGAMLNLSRLLRRQVATAGPRGGAGAEPKQPKQTWPDRRGS
ncbi:hypothetical protein [Actinomadura sp. NPDC049753]|uniref:hypothetical protein n=1 Tax=Actinomadura sp. NPDC049753 TaxID=3154739 RepID=UPI00342A3B6D